MINLYLHYQPRCGHPFRPFEVWCAAFAVVTSASDPLRSSRFQILEAHGVVAFSSYRDRKKYRLVRSNTACFLCSVPGARAEGKPVRAAGDGR